MRKFNLILCVVSLFVSCQTDNMFGNIYIHWGWGDNENGWFLDTNLNTDNGIFNNNRKEPVNIAPAN